MAQVPEPGKQASAHERAQDYLAQRSLRRTAGPVLLWGLGVGYVISGDFFGWNFGLNAGGWGGMLVAVLIMATLYTTMIFSIAEMATAMPVAGGPYAFARRAFGPLGGYLTGLAVTIEYVLAPAVIATGIGGYVAGLFPHPTPWLADGIPVLAYVVFVGVNLLGSQASLRLLLGITGISVAALLIWAVAMVPHFSVDHLLEVTPEPGRSRFLPHGPVGIIAALPAAGWFYLAIEGVPLAAEETRNPARDLPKGMIAAMLSLVGLSLLTLFLAPGAAGPEILGQSDNPLPTAVEAAEGRSFAYWVTTVVGLGGLVASFFSIVFAYSRQIFALSRAGYLPRWLSRTNRHHSPHWALIVPAALGWGTMQIVDALNPGTVGTGDLLLQMAVFAALISYVAMMVSHLVLRWRLPALHRPYRTPGYPLTPIVALGLSLLALSSTLFYGDAPMFAVLGTAAVIVVGLLYFLLWSRRHLVAVAPEEELALVRDAEAELDA